MIFFSPYISKFSILHNEYLLLFRIWRDKSIIHNAQSNNIRNPNYIKKSHHRPLSVGILGQPAAASTRTIGQCGAMERMPDGQPRDLSFSSVTHNLPTFNESFCLPES